MNQVITLAITKEKARTLTRFAVLVGVATTAPLLHQQALTGPIVNATLFAAAMFLDTQSAVLVGLIPSLIALSTGLLPPVLAPMVPFIMVGNTVLITTFNLLKEKNYWLGVVTASIVKFLFLYSTSTLATSLLLKKEIAAQVAIMLSWPQLFTALAGGLLSHLLCNRYSAR